MRPPRFLKPSAAPPTEPLHPDAFWESGGQFEESARGTKPGQISRTDVGANFLEPPDRIRIEIALATAQADRRRHLEPHDVVTGREKLFDLPGLEVGAPTVEAAGNVSCHSQELSQKSKARTQRT